MEEEQPSYLGNKIFGPLGEIDLQDCETEGTVWCRDGSGRDPGNPFDCSQRNAFEMLESRGADVMLSNIIHTQNGITC